MPREYGLDPYGIIASGSSMYGGTTGGFGGMGFSPTFKGGMPGVKFRTAFAEGGYADGGMASSLPFMGSTPPPPQRGNPYGGMDKDQRKSLNDMRAEYGLGGKKNALMPPMPVQPGFPSAPQVFNDLPFVVPGWANDPNAVNSGGAPSLIDYFTGMRDYLTGLSSTPTSPASPSVPQTGMVSPYQAPRDGWVGYGNAVNSGGARSLNEYFVDPTSPASPSVPQMQTDGTRPYGMGGASPYTINQPAGQMGGMPQSPMPQYPQPTQPQPMQPAMTPQAQRPGQMMRDQRQDQQQMQQPMQGGQMMNRPFAVRGR